MIVIAVCDDDEYYRELIKNEVKEYLNEIQIEFEIDTYKSGKELCSKGIKISKYDIVFLDVDMQEYNGIETAKKIRSINSNVYIVFATAFVSYAVLGYEVEAIRYLLKNNTNFIDTLKECIDAILAKMRYKIDKINFSFVEGKKEVLLERILYIESEKHKVIFHVMEAEMKLYTIYKKLDEIEELLEQHGFLRIHKSFLVNMKHVESMNNYKVKLTSGQYLSVPKLKYREVKEKFIMLKGEL